MSLRTKTATLARKAVSVISRAFRLSDVNGYREATERATGERVVTLDTAQQLSVIFSCVRLVAQTVACLPVQVYKRKPGGGREVAYDHEIYSLLHDVPNADQTAVEFWEEVIASLALRGKAYILKTYDVSDNLVAITPLEFDRMGTRRLLANNSYVYPYNHPTRGRVEYSEREIWEQRGYLGMSVIEYGARSMGAAMNAEDAAGRLFGNDLRPTAVLTRDEIFNKDQRRQIKEAIEDGMLRSTIGGSMRLIEGGMKYQQLSLTAEDAQLLASRQYSVEDLCRWIGVPPSMIGHGTAVSNWGTGREQINLSFLQYVLNSYTRRIEQGIRKNLIRIEDRRKYYAEFSVEGLLRADSAGRAAFYASAAQNGWMTRNEIRELENWPSVDGGNELTVQSNLVPVALLGQGTPAANAIDALKAALGIGADDKAEDKAHET